MAITQNAAQRNKMLENIKGKLRDLEDRIRRSNLHLFRLPDRENRDHRRQAIFEVIMLEKLPDVMKDMSPEKEKARLKQNK